MKYLVFWTGGVDSTRLVFDLLDQGHTVTTIYVEIVGNDAKTKRELSAIKTISKILHGKYPEFRELRSEGGPTASIDYHGEISKTLGLKQLPFFVFGMLFYADPTYDFVAMGYTMNDCAISYLGDLQALYQTTLGFHMRNPDPMPKLVFPLSKEIKQENWEYLPREVRQLVTWCERADVNSEPCGYCTPCVRMKNLKLWTESPKEFFDKEGRIKITPRLRPRLND